MLSEEVSVGVFPILCWPVGYACGKLLKLLIIIENPYYCGKPYSKAGVLNSIWKLAGHKLGNKAVDSIPPWFLSLFCVSFCPETPKWWTMDRKYKTKSFCFIIFFWPWCFLQLQKSKENKFLFLNWSYQLLVQVSLLFSWEMNEVDAGLQVSLEERKEVCNRAHICSNTSHILLML